MAEWLDRRHLRRAIAAITGCALLFAQIPRTHAAAQAGTAQLKREYGRIVSEAAIFKAFMTQVEQALATDFGDEKAAAAQFERLNRFSPDDISKGVVATLVLEAARNPQFQAGVRQRLAEQSPDELLKALDANPDLVRQIPGAAAAETDVRRSLEAARGKVAALKKKAEGRAGLVVGETVPEAGVFDPAWQPRGGPWATERAQTGAEIFIAVMAIMLVAAMIIVVVASAALVIYEVQAFLRLVQRMTSAYLSYSACYNNALRQSTYWGRELAKLGCLLAFLR